MALLSVSGRYVACIAGLLLLAGGCEDSSTSPGTSTPSGGGGSQGGATPTGGAGGDGAAAGTGGGAGGNGGFAGATADCPPDGPNGLDELCSPDEDETQCDVDLYCFYPGTPELCTCCATCRPWGEECTSATPSNKAVFDAPDCSAPHTTCFMGYCVTWLPD